MIETLQTYYPIGLGFCFITFSIALMFNRMDYIIDNRSNITKVLVNCTFCLILLFFFIMTIFFMVEFLNNLN